MSTFFERLMQLANYQGIKNPNELADALGYKSPEKLYRLQRDNNASPSFAILTDISNLFENADIRWLVTGRGNTNMYVNTPPDKEVFSSANDTKETYTHTHKQANVSAKPPHFVSPTVSPSHENCVICVEKERIISNQQLAIDTLRELVDQLRIRVEELGGQRKKQTG